jgi:hypothetical protein
MANAEVRDDHDYNQNPETFRQRWQDFFGRSAPSLMPSRYASGQASRLDLGVPFWVSEFGGIGWAAEGGWGYGTGPKTLDEFYARYEGLVNALLDNPDMFGFCYTQLTDVEQEKNGLYFYDRKPKFDVQRLHKITSRVAAYEKTGPSTGQPKAQPENPWRVLVGGAADGELCQPYRYTTTNPVDGWMNGSFDDNGWQSARAPFGTIANPRTRWESSDIWLRRTFEWQGGDIKDAALVIFWDEDTEVFVNGKKIWNRSGFVTSYEMFSVTEALKSALRKGQNTLAVHTRQTGGGQFIDLALLASYGVANVP